MEDEDEEKDCCGSGCNPCILDERKRLKNQKVLVPSKNVLSQVDYTKFVISDLKKESEQFLVINFQLKDSVTSEDCGIILQVGQYVIIRISTVSRSLTPISWDDSTFKILFKVYEDGKLSCLMKQKQIGNEVDVRGPYGDFLYTPNSFSKIVMFSIGSGIAAMFPIINAIISNESDETKVQLNSSFRNFSNVPLKEDLRRFTDFWNFACTIFLTQECDNNVLTGIQLVNKVRLNSNTIESCLKNLRLDTTLILICGTEEFNQMAKTTVERCHFSNIYVFE